jgi:hypothetical protein
MYNNKKIAKSSNKCKMTWDIIKQLPNKQHLDPDTQELMVEGKHLKYQQDIADAFNNYYSSVINNINNNNVNNKINDEGSFTCNIYLEQVNVNPPPSSVIKLFSTKELTSIIKILKSKNTYGYDEISTKVLKLCANYIRSPLTYICNKSILSGVFPDRLKSSVVKPIYKTGDRTDPANYRPISSRTSFSKVLEKVLHIRLSEHLNCNKLLVYNKFGFRKGIAVNDVIFKLTNDVLNALNNKKVTGNIFCNLEKAFNSVNHVLLVSKLPHFGISGKAKLLLESYLNNTYQRTKIKNSHSNYTTISKWTKIKYGVPHGSILGPIWFLLYNNDLPKATAGKATSILFADDTSILISSPNISQFQNDS